MRIVSLLPSATEIVCALDLRDQLVGVTHRCDYPPEIEGVAVITRPLGTAVGGADAVSAVAYAVDDIGPFELDVDAFLECRPDLVLVRDGAGLGMDQVRKVLKDFAGERPEVVSLDPVSVEGIFHTVTVEERLHGRAVEARVRSNSQRIAQPCRVD